MVTCRRNDKTRPRTKTTKIFEFAHMAAGLYFTNEYVVRFLLSALRHRFLQAFASLHDASYAAAGEQLAENLRKTVAGQPLLGVAGLGLLGCAQGIP